MKQVIANYTFNAAGKTITLSDFGTVRLDRLALITNVTNNVILYNFADPTLGATVSSNVITLVGANTTGMSNTDKLQIIYDSSTSEPVYDLSTTIAVGSTKVITGNSASGVGQDFFPSTDCSGYARAIFQVAPGFTGTIQLQESNNNSDWTAIQECFPLQGGALSSNIQTNGAMTEVPIRGRYLRARVTNYTTGTTSGTVVLLTADCAPRLMGVTQSGNWSVFLKPLVNNGQATTSMNSAASTNATLVRASQVGLLYMMANNTTASNKYVRFYAKSSLPVPGTDSPTMVFTIPPNSSKEVNFGAYGVNLSPGFGYAITGGAAFLDNTAVAAGDVQLCYSIV